MLLWVAVPWAAACRQKTPEEKIREEVLAMARAAEERRLTDVMEHISTRFHSAEGWDRDEVKGVIASEIMRGALVKVWVAHLDVSLDSSTRARMKGQFVLGRSDAKNLQDLLGQSQVDAYEIDGELEL
ncbi:MAG TPA: hypothetical protein VH208_14560, partial [Myxococcaceae bacterium]|nr:hypothetical protein [Myxococcaceae bacterium]